MILEKYIKTCSAENIMRNKIISEIQRLTRENAGKPPGKQKFTKETNIKFSEWYPSLWLRWGDALNEAGFEHYFIYSGFDRKEYASESLPLVVEAG